MADELPVIVFGAFDRHNFGDLLFAHIAAAWLRPRPLVFAGLAERDLTPFGGHRVHAIAELAREWGGRPADLVHAGGEILSCSLYEAAVMLQAPEDAAAAIALYDGDPVARLAWAQDRLGLPQQIAYLVPKGLFRNPGRFLHTAVGGTELAALPGALRQEAFTRLREADYVSVRDRVTLATLDAHGIHADLVPDPAVLTATLFGSIVDAHSIGGEPRDVSDHFHQGYIAVQFSADFGDDASLQGLARQLDQVARGTGLGIVLFRAGAAPWHDDLAVYERLQGFMAPGQAALFASRHLWDICALLAGARAYCGSSLHGRIVAEAFGVPGIHLLRASSAPGKLVAYAGTWSSDVAALLATPGDLAQRLLAALATETAARRRHAQHQRALAERATQAWRSLLS